MTASPAASRCLAWPANPFAVRLHMTVLVGATLLGAGHARAETPAACATPTAQEIVLLMYQWKSYLAAGDAERIAAFYADDATLVATATGAPYKGKQAIRTYYTDLLAHHPQAKIISRNVTPGCNSATVTGVVLYRVTGTRKGTRTLLGGQYTTEFARQGNAWQIVQHKLAADPRKIGDVLPMESGAPL